MISEACDQLDDHHAVPHLLNACDAALASLAPYWPSESDTTVSRYLRGYENPIGNGLYSMPSFAAAKALDVNRLDRELWSRPEISPPEPLPEAARWAAEKARALLASRLEAIKSESPPVGGLALTGHAHIDLAWLWPLAESRRKGRRTFASVLGLMERYEDFTFNQSSAQLYAWIEEDDPELFERVKERVAQGRWEPVGGSWCEPDCQVTGGESFVRQLLLGQRYFEEKLGHRCTVAWLPDAFGFSPGIPQLLRGAGISGFFTAKLKWSETNLFPHDLFAWEGIDGSLVTAHTILNPGSDYNGDIVPFDVLGVWNNFGGKRRHQESLFAFGWGDGGGGPSDRMLENYARLREFPALPRLRMAYIEEYFAALPESGLPVWVGELYLEFHRGTLTTQARTKALNRASEHRLLEAEAFAAIAQLTGFPYPHDEIETAWKTVLLNQFHDIIPGSSIAEVYQDTIPELEGIVGTATAVRDAALVHLGGIAQDSGSSQRVTVANAALAPRPLTVLLEGQDGDTTLTDIEGAALPTQQVEEGLLLHDPARVIPGLGWLNLTMGPGDPHSAGSGPAAVRMDRLVGGPVLENELLRVEIGEDGTLSRIVDKAVGDRDVLADRGNQLWIFIDKPRTYDAWDIEENYESEGNEIGGLESIEVVEVGPLRGAVRVRRAWRDSRIEQTYRLLSGSRRLDIATRIDWHERQTYLQARFPLAVHSHEATYETLYGVTRRPTHRNTSWDASRYEVGGHRFADLSEPDYGVALLNDAKYGYSAHGSLLTLSMLRSPLYPDPGADEGRHAFTYSLFPHPGDWTEVNVVNEAFALNSPLIVVPAAGSGPDGEIDHLFDLDGLPLSLGSLKRAEDGEGLILRLHEPHGNRGHATLRFQMPLRRVERVNLLEEPAADPAPVLAEDERAIRLDVRPFEVVSLRVVLSA